MTKNNKQKLSFSILVLILGLISINTQATISREVNVGARVIPSTTSGGVTILINGGTPLIPTSSATSIEYKATPEPVVIQAPVPNKIIEIIEEFLLPRTGGQGRVLNFSFLISLLGLLICISALRRKKKHNTTHKKHE